MTLTINGELRETQYTTLGALLESLKIHPQTVAVEYNGEILSRQLFAQLQLSNGDVLEIVQMMAGG